MKKTKTSPKAKKVTPKAKKTAPKKKTQGAKAGSAKDPKKKKTTSPKKESTHVIAVLDRSGSMSSVAQAAIDGYNEFLGSQKKLKDKATISGVLFSDPDKIEPLFDGKTIDIKDAPELTMEKFRPDGWTALCDAIGKAVNNYKATPAGKEGKEKVLVLIITDGAENKSIEFNKKDIFDLITYQKKQNWQFIFLCSTEDAFKVGAEFGVAVGNTHKFENSSLGNKKLYNKVAKATANYRSMTMYDAFYAPAPDGVLKSEKLMSDIEDED